MNGGLFFLPKIAVVVAMGGLGAPDGTVPPSMTVTVMVVVDLLPVLFSCLWLSDVVGLGADDAGGVMIVRAVEAE